MNLQNLRKNISEIDDKIIDLLRKRLEITNQVWEYKIKNNLEIFDKNREEEIFQNISEKFSSDKNWVISLWKELMNISKRWQNNIFRKNENTIKIGIQGWEWSFNHIAIQDFLTKNPDFSAGKDIEIVYLYTTEAVLENLNNGSIDFWQFAIANSIGWLVYETMSTLWEFHWKFLKNYHIAVKHSIFLHPEAKIEEIDTIMWHEQAIRQCEKNLSKKFPNIKLIGWTGDLTDNASIAKAVSEGNLPKNIACIWNKILSEIYQLSLFMENIQDREDNETTFVLVKL